MKKKIEKRGVIQSIAKSKRIRNMHLIKGGKGKDGKDYFVL
jgi:hypothetical protein